MSVSLSKTRGAPRQSQEVRFIWTENRGKSKRSREIKAPNKVLARKKLAKLNINPTSIEKAENSTFRGMSVKDKSAFIRQLTTMLISGVPLSQSIALIEKSFTSRRSKPMSTLCKQIKADIDSGIRLSDALRKYPKAFDNLFCNTLRAGEEAGQMEVVLTRLANYLDKAIKTRKRIKKAMTYPSAVVIVAMALTVCVLLFVIPSFSGIYPQFKTELPALTQGLISASEFMQNDFLWVFLFFASAVVVVSHLYKTNLRAKDTMDGLILKMPVVGKLIRTATFARWIRTMSTLNSSGVPILQTLDSVASTCTISRFRQVTIDIKAAVGSGTRLSVAMKASKQFPDDMSQMIQIGEEAGELNSMLECLAKQQESTLDDIVDNLSSIIEPIFMSLIGVLVGVLIVGMHLPIFNLGSIV